MRAKGEDGAESREAGDTGGGGSTGGTRKLRSTWRDEEERKRTVSSSSGASIGRDSHIPERREDGSYKTGEMI